MGLRAGTENLVASILVQAQQALIGKDSTLQGEASDQLIIIAAGFLILVIEIGECPETVVHYTIAAEMGRGERGRIQAVLRAIGAVHTPDGAYRNGKLQYVTGCRISVTIGKSGDFNVTIIGGAGSVQIQTRFVDVSRGVKAQEITPVKHVINR